MNHVCVKDVLQREMISLFPALVHMKTSRTEAQLILKKNHSISKLAGKLRDQTISTFLRERGRVYSRMGKSSESGILNSHPISAT